MNFSVAIGEDESWQLVSCFASHVTVPDISPIEEGLTEHLLQFSCDTRKGTTFSPGIKGWEYWINMDVKFGELGSAHEMVSQC